MWPLRKISSCIAAVVPVSRLRLRKFIYKNAKKPDLFWLFASPDFFRCVYRPDALYAWRYEELMEKAKGTCYAFKCKYLGAMPCCRRITFEYAQRRYLYEHDEASPGVNWIVDIFVLDNYENKVLDGAYMVCIGWDVILFMLQCLHRSICKGICYVVEMLEHLVFVKCKLCVHLKVEQCLFSLQMHICMDWFT